MRNESKGWKSVLLTVFLAVLAIFFLAPIFLVLMNSFKGQFYISDAPFALPDSETFVGLRNYWNGIEKVGFFSAFGYSAFITVFSVAAIVLFTAMTAWYLVRIKTRTANALYYLFVFSMIVPFQMVMFTMSKMANLLRLDNPLGIILLYLGFGSGLSVFLYSGFIKSIPLDVEEAAMIDGCRPLQTFFFVVFPILKPTAITVAILNAMWIWNDYLLPYLVIGSRYRTIPIAVQYLQGGYGSRDMGALMATLILAIIPIVIFYLACQKYIIRGVMAGAVKG
ncbi:MAG: carbohydrate ABC transporter permease [Oscillospiraceae bacterium]|nr:carbohydrate ABC transporter permease [Oscillospiraceae bacterium]MDD7041447.1 carbohydrate ABC transporter permease [Oscillospiraceae bacterium]MDY2610659.1 carbohydrate ABC transporter permease [Oscillospiraceae bacterium]